VRSGRAHGESMSFRVQTSGGPKHLRGGSEVAAFLESSIGGTVSGKMTSTQPKAIASASRVVLAGP